MASILIKNGRIWDGEQFLYADVLTDKAGNHIANDQGYRCVMTVADGEVVYRH